jgi:hypothetical protein
VSDTFYWPNNEIHQGIGWLMLAFAVNFSMAGKKWPLAITLPVFVASFFLAIWTHPLVMIVAVYLWFLFLSDNSSWPFTKLQSIVYSIILLLLSYFKLHQGTHHGYDSTKIEAITGFHPHTLQTIFIAPQLHFFIKSCCTNYWLFALLFIIGLIGLIKEKKYLALLWTLLVAGGYLLLVCITFWDATSNRFYIESEYMPLSIICSAPFVYFVLPRLQKNTSVAIIIVICLVRLVYIYSAAPLFTNRIVILNNMNNKMREKSLTKIVIPVPVAGVDSALIMSWGAPVESILLSSLKGERPQRTFIFANSDELKADLKTGKDTLIGCWDLRGPGQVNNRYFDADTTTPYIVESYTDLMK